MSPDDPRHGKVAGRAAHVRDGEKPCRRCLDAMNQYAADVRRQQAYGRWNPWVDAEPARQHVLALMAAGMPYRHIAIEVGVTNRRINSLLYVQHGGQPPSQRIRANFAAALLAINPRPSRVPILGAGRRLQALMALGHSRVVLGAELGVSAARVDQLAHMRDDTIMRETHDRIDDLFRRWCLRVPSPTTRREKQAATRTKNESARRGWVPPLAWDDIDDRDEIPSGVAGAEPERQRGVTVERYLEDAAWLADGDLSLSEVLERLGVNRDTFRDTCRREGRNDLFVRLADREFDAEHRRATRAGLQRRKAAA